MGGRSVLVPIVGLSLALYACEDTAVSRPRSDLGVVQGDAGEGGPLLLLPGMHFEYEGRLTRRESTGAERDAIFMLSITITAVDDRGAAGDSRVSYEATGVRTFDQNWTFPDAGADSWVARLGPADPLDTVGTDPVEVVLGNLPGPPLFPKELPQSSTLLFLDLRNVDRLRGDWTERHASQSPRTIDASQHPSGHLALEIDGMDTLEYYDAVVQRRAISIEYDPIGFVAKITETLGDLANHPNTQNGAFSLNLKSMTSP